MDIENYEKDGVKIKNRYVVTYFSKTDYVYKKYIVDINFRNNKGNPDNFKDIPKIQIFGTLEDASYNSDFDYTLSQDCKAIKTSLANPQQIKCNEVVDKDGYIVKGVYDVDAKFIMGTSIKDIHKRVRVVSKMQRDPIKPSLPPIKH